MKIFQNIKNKFRTLALSVFLSLPTEKKEIIVKKQFDDKKDSDISEEDAIKFAENAIEYTPENKAKMITYYEEFRNLPKTPYIVGQVGTRLDLDSRKGLGEGLKVKRKT